MTPRPRLLSSSPSLVQRFYLRKLNKQIPNLENSQIMLSFDRMEPYDKIQGRHDSNKRIDSDREINCGS